MKSLGASGREYVYVYEYHTNCSEVGLHELEEFMCIDKATTSTIIVATATATATVTTTATSSIMATTASTASLYDNHGLLQLQPNNSSLVAALAVPVPPSKYSWVRDPLHGWSWSESVWNERLGSCLKLAFGNVTISEGFRWTPSNYKSNLLSLFRNLTQEHCHITPFMGYSDFALIGHKRVSIIQHVMMGKAEITAFALK